MFGLENKGAERLIFMLRHCDQRITVKMTILI